MKLLVVFGILFSLLSAAFAAGEYYVPKSYYLIDESGQETNPEPIPVSRLRRALNSAHRKGPHPVRRQWHGSVYPASA